MPDPSPIDPERTRHLVVPKRTIRKRRAPRVRVVQPPPDPPKPLDILEGGQAIARFLFGTDDRRSVKRVTYFSSASMPPGRRLPTFFLGGLLCARASAIVAWIERQEAEGPRRVPEEEATPLDAGQADAAE